MYDINNFFDLVFCGLCGENLSDLILSMSLQAPPAVQEIPESFVDDFVVTESASAVEVAIAESAAVEPVRITTVVLELQRIKTLN